MDWLHALQTCQERGEVAVLVTLAAVRGHAPRGAGAKMVVGLHETHGSVGGGNLEETAVDRARQMLRLGHAEPELLTLRLTDRAPAEFGRQCCGGEVTLLLELVQAASITPVDMPIYTSFDGIEDTDAPAALNIE